ncbi:MAG: hypothetical protein L0214_07525, partial [candidate division NC10 bacterium]|nr:hypothetical protein [candidate division NC10 bacterium]
MNALGLLLLGGAVYALTRPGGTLTATRVPGSGLPALPPLGAPATDKMSVLPESFTLPAGLVPLAPLTRPAAPTHPPS